jgi:Arc/MetJ-type ribon-helix-helix transcriptional regulator
MTITLQPEQEQAIEAAIQRGAFRSVDEFIDAAIATLPGIPAAHTPSAPRKSKLWELRKDLTLGDLSIKDLIEEGRE